MDKIVLKDVCYRYPTGNGTPLKHINLTVKAGEVCAVIGGNGAGKTTLLNVIRGFAPKFYDGDFSGEVLVDGQNIASTSLGDLALTMGYVFQNPFTQISGNADTVFDEIAYGLENIGVPPVTIVEKVNAVIALLGIDYLRNRNPFDLSGGQQQRVAFAAIIAMDPGIFIIDEPTSQLDPQGTADVFAIIDMLKQQQKTIVLVEHKMEHIAQYADHVVLLHDGAVVLDATAQDVMSNPICLTCGTTMSQYAQLGLALNDTPHKLSVVPICEADAFRQLNAKMGVGACR